MYSLNLKSPGILSFKIDYIFILDLYACKKEKIKIINLQTF